MRRFLLVTVSIFLSFSLFAETVEKKDEKKSDDMITVEQAYLNSMEGVIIKEMVLGEGRDSKLVALQYIENALKEGRVSPEIQSALDTLATVGLTTVSREDGRVINDFPDIRTRACDLLSRLKTPESRDTLIKVLYYENYPTVVASAVHALGEIGINDNDETVDVINWVNKKFSIIDPTSYLALEILNAYEKLAPKVKDKKPVISAIMGIAANHNYVTPVRNRALAILKELGKSK